MSTPDLEDEFRSMAYPAYDPWDDPEQDAQVQGGGDDARPRPVLWVTNAAIAGRQLRTRLGTGPTSGIFRRGDQLVRTPHIGENGYRPLVSPGRAQLDSEYQVRPLSGLQLAAELDHVYDVRREVTRKDGTVDAIAVEAPLSMCNRVVAAPDNAPNVRPLAGVSRVPFARPDWTICTTPGYDADTGVLYIPRDDTRPIRVPTRPGAGDVRAAVDLLSLMLSGFPFNSDDDRANYMAALIWPVIVRTVEHVLPALLLNAHQPGSGKTLLAKILLSLFDGTVRPDFPTGKEEQEKELAAILSANTGGVVVFDNCRGMIRSGTLEALLTTRHNSVRRLGTNDERLHVVNDRLWVLTGNNLAIAGDLPRRVVWCNIDPGMPHPETRSDFAIANLEAWTRTHRHDIIGALLTLVANWVADGRPVNPSRTDTFADSIDVAQGILATAGIAGTVASMDTKPLVGLDEDDEWASWYEALLSRFGTEPFTAGQITAALNAGDNAGKPEADPDRQVLDTLPGEIAARRDSHAGLSGRSLGMFLKNRHGRWFHNYALHVIHDARNGNAYRIQMWEQTP